MKKNFSIAFLVGLICIFLLSSIIHRITHVNSLPTTVGTMNEITQNPQTNTSESIKKLITTGEAKNGNLEGVDITASLKKAGALLVNEDYQEYELKKFGGRLNLEGANLKGASFRRLRLESINLRNADLTNADLSDVIWEKADFTGAKLWLVRFNKAVLKNANFDQVQLDSADMLGADFSNANFAGVFMDGVDIRAANFTGANCEGATFDSDGPRDPQYLGANFTDANLKGAEIAINGNKFIYFCRTIMPDGTINNRDCELAEKWSEASYPIYPQEGSP